MKLGVLMDPLASIKPYKDSSVAMLKSAQELALECYYFTPKDIYCSDGKAYAFASRITILDIKSHSWAKTGKPKAMPLSDFSIILMRKDPPFDMEYIYATYALDLAVKEGVLVANRPQSLRDANEKFFTLHFPQCCPETLVSKNIQQLKAFFETHREVIYKPLEGMGGKSVFHVDSSGKNLSVILETLTEGESKFIMAQVYMPDIKTTGDKRILLIDGHPQPFALARIPAPNELRGNLAAGARGKVVALSKRDKEICAAIGPTLRARGLYFVGIDVIGSFLTEINVTSPTCIVEIEAETQLDIAGAYIRSLIKKLS